MIKAGTGFVRPRFFAFASGLDFTGRKTGYAAAPAECARSVSAGWRRCTQTAGRTGARFSGQPGSYVPEYDVMLQDGEIIGFSADKKYTITCSEGVSLPGMTLKICYDAAD